MPKDNQNKPTVLRPIIMAVITIILIIIFLLLALFFRPTEKIPVFVISERDWITKQKWEVHDRITVFDEKIKPGDNGQYQFILKNESDTDLIFGIHFFEYLETTALAHSFMQYQLKASNINVDDDDSAWHHAEEMKYSNIIILPQTEILMTLNWQWVFENGNDENDTLIGVAGGTISISFIVFAEVA